MASILDQDLGSESEEGDFNPDPGADSDNEDASGSEQGHHTKKKTNNGHSSEGIKSRKPRSAEDEDDSLGADEIGRRQQTKDSRRIFKRDKDDFKNEDNDQDDLVGNNGVYDDENEDEDEEDEEDDDDEDAISVRYIAWIDNIATDIR